MNIIRKIVTMGHSPQIVQITLIFKFSYDKINKHEAPYWQMLIFGVAFLRHSDWASLSPGYRGEP